MLACEVMLLMRVWLSGEILFFPMFAFYLAANCVTAPLYITRNFMPWYWTQLAVNTLLLCACWEAFDLLATPARMRPDPKVPHELQMLAGASVLFGVVLMVLVAQRPIQENLPPVLYRLRLFPIVMACGFLFETWGYFLLQPPGRYHPKASAHAVLLLTFNMLTVGSLLIPVGNREGRKWELIQITQQAMRVGIVLVWINLFWKPSRNRTARWFQIS